MHGGNVRLRWLPALCRGLSPRARGELSISTSSLPLSRTIPACTGGTRPSCLSFQLPSDYPRVHGGNFSLRALFLSVQGLSPRARGEPKSRYADKGGRRTIPACTGGTLTLRVRVIINRDYPRVHGGNNNLPNVELAFLGLSPRARGELRFSSLASPASRTIPACTGGTYISLRSRPL